MGLPETVQSCRLFVTPWTIAHQAPLSMEFSRQESWSGLPGWSVNWLYHRGREFGSNYQNHNGTILFFFNLTALGLSCGLWTLNCSIWDLAPWPGIKPRAPALGSRSLSHRTSRGVPAWSFWFSHPTSGNLSCRETYTGQVFHWSLVWYIQGLGIPQCPSAQ